MLRYIESLETVLGLGRIPLCEAGYVASSDAPFDKAVWGRSNDQCAPNAGLRSELPVPPRAAAAADKGFSGEASLRQKLGIPENVREAVKILRELQRTGSVLLGALARDVHEICQKHLGGLFSIPPGDNQSEHCHPFTIRHSLVGPTPTENSNKSKIAEEAPALYASERERRRVASRIKESTRINVNGQGRSVGVTDPFERVNKITRLASKVIGYYVFLLICTNFVL